MTASVVQSARRPMVRWRAAMPATAGPWLVAAGAACTCVAVNLADPNEAGNYPTCPFLAVTGLQCPGCGTLRAIRALTRGDVALAASLNVLSLAMLPVLLWAWFGWLQHRRGGPAMLPEMSATAGMVVAISVPLFWIARNLPVAPLSWLAP